MSGDRLDREAATRLLLWTYGGREVDQIEDVLDRLEECVVRPAGVTFTRERIRAELIDSLPPNPKSAIWVDGVLDRLEAES